MVASCIFRHMGVGVVTSSIIQMLPKMQEPTKLLSKTEPFPQKSFRADFLFSSEHSSHSTINACIGNRVIITNIVTIPQKHPPLTFSGVFFA